jgi:simple sugar transport system substrate-binding protein
MLAAGVKKAASESPGVQVAVIEGGFNQAEWETKLTSLAATGTYGLIVSSNPAMPALCAAVSAKFPKQHFLLLDGKLEGNPRIFTLRYNQREQAYMAGHIAALVSRSSGAAAKPRLGLVVGQEYPAMNNIILPGYLEGARAVDPAFQVDFRVVGNWYDAAKGAELASAMIRDGAGVVLAIAGGANQGVLQAADEAGAKVVWFDVNGYALRPGVVVGSSVLWQDRASYEQVKRYLAGTLPFGSAEIVGVAQGYVDFIEDDPHYLAGVPGTVRAKQSALVASLRAGAFRLDEAGR